MEMNLNEREKIILQALYKEENRPVGINELSKETLINRTTLYPMLEKLVSKGLVSYFVFEGKKVFQSISIEELKDLLTRKEKEFKKNSENILSWAQSVKSVKNNSLLSNIKYFEGFDGVKNLYSDSWRENKGKMIYAITDYKSAYECMKDFFKEDYFKARVKHGVRVKNLLPESEEGKRDLNEAKDLLREMKFIKIFQDLNIEVNIYDSKLSIIAFDKSNPSGVLIKNEKIAEAFKNIFEYIWKKTNKTS
jgi:sugar-specific transcriptional regulator TrmB